MKIAFVYGSNITHRPIELSNVWQAPRGLTGSELSCLSYAREFAQLGHDVSLFLDTDLTSWQNIKIRGMGQLKDQDYDIMYVWNNPDLLNGINSNTLRVVNQQLNDFHYCKPDFDSHVDIYTSPSLPHKDHITRLHCLDPDKWFIVPNGCDPRLYHGDKVRGRVIYASSPDRGLHHLLEIWPSIRKAVPHAQLRIFYDMSCFASLVNVAENDKKVPVVQEWCNRLQFIKEKINQLEGVENIGSVSRDRMVHEFSEAEVLAYPCDTVIWTEGFSVTTLEACAAEAVPVITSADALGFLYGKVAPFVFMPVKWQLKEYSELVIKALTEPDRSKLKEFSYNYEWSRLAKSLEKFLIKALELK